MSKLKLPKKPHTGLKIYCHKCKSDNPSCNHFDIHKYRVRIHVSGTKNKKVTKVLNSRNYKDAVVEAIVLEKELKQNSYQKIKTTSEGNDYSIVEAIIRYNQYLSGNYEFAQHEKTVTVEHRKECIRFCRYFCNTLKDFKDIEKTRIVDVNKSDVARFYSWADNHYESRKTFNKCMSALKTFFNFLIDIEEIKMKNPFATYESKQVSKTNVETLTRDEFNSVINAVGVLNPVLLLGGKGERKNMFKPYLVHGFKLFLLTGGRREEVVDLLWSDILTTVEGIKFFKIGNKKVNRRKKTNEFYKYIPINEDLFDVLIELGYNEKKNSNDYILFPERKIKSSTIMNDLSKGFTHYKKAALINKKVSLKNLRKTYITWMYRSMGQQTQLLTSHSGEQVLKDHYIDAKVLSSIEEAMLNFKVFGK